MHPALPALCPSPASAVPLSPVLVVIPAGWPRGGRQLRARGGQRQGKLPLNKGTWETEQTCHGFAGKKGGESTAGNEEEMGTWGKVQVCDWDKKINHSLHSVLPVAGCYMETVVKKAKSRSRQKHCQISFLSSWTGSNSTLQKHVIITCHNLQGDSYINSQLLEKSCRALTVKGEVKKEASSQ